MANLQLFNISLGDEMRDVYYFQQISHGKEKLIFKVPWGGAIIRNSLTSGELLGFKTVREYEVFKKENNKMLWLFLPLQVFRSENAVFAIFCCPQCETMAGTDKLSLDQDPTEMLSRLCVHSKVCSTILGDWRDIWDINVSPLDQVVRIVCNEELKFHTFQKQSKEDTLVAATRTKDEVALLYTVTRRQDTPFCSICITKKCPHANSYSRDREEEERTFVSSVGTMVEEQEEQTVQGQNSDSVSTVSESGSDSGSSTEDEVRRAEKGKHINYWVNIFF